MTDRDRLIELLSGKSIDTYADVEYVADYLIANGGTVNEWRPASEPPKEDGAYLTFRNICDKHFIYQVSNYANDLFEVDKQDFAYYGKGVAGWYTNEGNGYFEIHDITHWMPLPQQPKEVDKCD